MSTAPKTTAELLDSLKEIHNAAVDAWNGMDDENIDRQYLLQELCQRVFAITKPAYEAAMEEASR